MQIYDWFCLNKYKYYKHEYQDYKYKYNNQQLNN